jgi:hypothetical protein
VTRLAAAALAAVVSGCILPPLPSPTPLALSPTPTPSATPTPTPEPTSTPEPTPDPAAIPSFESGDVVATTLSGMRVRRLPGTTSQVVTGLLPDRNELQVIMGPVVADGFGWYLVSDADAREPQFDEGWVAAGYQPEPFLTATGRTPGSNPYPAGFAHTGDAEFGPVEVVDEHYAIRWLAFDPAGVGCAFTVSLAAGSAPPVPAIRATIGTASVPGTLQPSYFHDQTSLRGQLFVTIQSTCTWALVFVRVPPPGASPTP